MWGRYNAYEKLFKLKTPELGSLGRPSTQQAQRNDEKREGTGIDKKTTAERD